MLADKARAHLREIAAAGRSRRRLQIVARDGMRVQTESGEWLLNFCSNDYLGLAQDPRLSRALAQAAGQGVGSTASQHVCGFHQQQAALEEELAAALEVERVLVGGSGFALNTGALPVLAGRDDLLCSDARNHASLIDGCRLSRAPVHTYPHLDLAALQALLQTPVTGQRWVVSDTLFSMDGDVAPLAELAQRAQAARATLYLDDAHGFGWAGAGRGHVHAAGLASPDVVQMLTFGKALGSYGAALAGQRDVIEWLLQAGRTTMFATALPPAVCAATRAALQICLQEPEHRQSLLANVATLRAQMQRAGLSLLPSDSPIQALILGSEQRAVSWQEGLRARGYWVSAIRPPTVAPGTARLRITLSAAHRPADIAGLCAALADIAAAECRASA